MANATPISYFISKGPVVDEEKYLGEKSHSTAKLTLKNPEFDIPRIPFMAWGLRFDEDLMISLEDDYPWGMIEVSKIFLPDGSHVWFTLDSKLTGKQYVGVPKDSPNAQELIKSFPAPTYQLNNFSVSEETLSASEKKYHVQYQRLDKSNISFKMKVKSTPKPPPFRNGNAMNHSQGTSLAILDLNSIQLAGSGFKFLNDGQSTRKAQRVIGQKVAALMSQSVGGIMSGNWEQKELSITAENNFVIDFEALDNQDTITLVTKNLFPLRKYHFDKVNKENQTHYELREIVIEQKVPQVKEVEVARFRFNPSLPDLRFGPPTHEFTSKMVTSIARNKGYQKGVVSFIKENNQNLKTKVSVLSEKPTWAKSRPVITHIQHKSSEQTQQNSFRSTVLASGGLQVSSSETNAPKPQKEIESFQSFDVFWEKTPHRLSEFKLVTPATGKSPAIELGGGTWANGKFATDKNHSMLKTVLLTGADFYNISTPEFELVQPELQNTSFETKIAGSHKIKINFDEKINNKTPLVWINGVHFISGPLHKDTGITPKKFNVSIDSIKHSNSQLTLTISAVKAFGSVSDRTQNHKDYSGAITVDLALAWIDSNESIEVKELNFNKQTAKCDSKCAAKKKFELIPCISENPALEKYPYLFQSFGFEVLDQSKNSGRYLRRLAFSNETHDQFDLFNNLGLVAKPTKYKIHKKLIRTKKIESIKSVCYSSSN